MNRNSKIQSFLMLLLFAVSILLTPSSYAQSSPDIVDVFNYFGQDIELKKTEFPGVYEDATQQRWIPVDISKTPGMPRYIQINKASPQQLSAATELNIKDRSGVYIDHRGEEWFRVTDKEGNIHNIRINEADPSELIRAFGQFDFKGIPLNSLINLPKENLKFSSALLAVQLSTCFGPSALKLTFESALDTPTCLDDFVAHLLDWKGWVSFYAFMVANRYTNEGLMRALMETAKHVGDKHKIPYLRQKWMPLFGYIGMAAGSTASQIVSHFLNNPHWGECISLLKTEGLTSQPCIDAFTNFMDAEQFWDDFFAGTPSLLTSSFAAHISQQLIVSNYRALTDSAVAKKMGLKLIGGSEQAIKLAARLGTKAVTGVKLTVAVVGGVPGVVVFVATEIGQFVLFLAWEEVLRAPFYRSYHDLTKSSKVKEGIELIDRSTAIGKESQWKKAFVETTKKCTNKMVSRYKSVQECVDVHEEPLTKGLSLLNYGASKYRNKVLLDGMKEEMSAWGKKTSSYLNKYRATKIILEHIYREKQLSQGKPVSLDLISTSQQLVYTWIDAISIETPGVNERFMLPLITALADITTSISISTGATPVNNNTGMLDSMDPSKQDFSGVLLPELTPVEKLRQQMIDFQNNSGRYFSNLFPSSIGFSTCLVAPRTCMALNETLEIDFSKLTVYTPLTLQNNVALLENIIGIFGPDVVTDIFYDLMCSRQETVVTRSTGNSGLVAHFDAPFLLKLDDRSADEFYRQNCRDFNQNEVFQFAMEDFGKIWFVNNKVYPDPISLLIDSAVPLKPGSTLADATLWWHQNAFPPTANFMKSMTIRYHELLNKTLFSKIPPLSPADLIYRTQPVMRGPELDHHIVTLALDMWNRPALSESLMGHTTYLLDTIKYGTPHSEGKSELVAKLKTSLAKYIQGVHHIINTEALASEWDKYSNDIQSAGIEVAQLDAANSTFDANIKKMTLSESKVNEIASNRTEIFELLSQLYLELTQFNYDDLKAADKKRYKEEILPEEVGKLSTEEYKKYIFFRLEYDSLSKIVIEIDELYGKLGLNPLLGLPENTLNH